MTIPITDLVTLAKMSPRATAGLQAAGVETAEQAAAMTDAELLAIPYFKGESLGRLRQWQKAGGHGGDPGFLRRPRAVQRYLQSNDLDLPAGGIPTSITLRAVPRSEAEKDLAERLLVEMVKSSNNPGPSLADMAWQAAERFYDRLEARKEKLHGERGAGSAGAGGGDEGDPGRAAAGRPEEPVG